MGSEDSLQGMDIAHRVSTRRERDDPKLSGGWRKEKSWKFVKERLKLTPQVSVCVLIPSSMAEESLIILLPKAEVTL